MDIRRPRQPSKVRMPSLDGLPPEMRDFAKALIDELEKVRALIPQTVAGNAPIESKDFISRLYQDGDKLKAFSRRLQIQDDQVFLSEEIPAGEFDLGTSIGSGGGAGGDTNTYNNIIINAADWSTSDY